MDTGSISCPTGSSREGTCAKCWSAGSIRRRPRAVSEALPLLRLAKQVNLATVQESDKGRPGGTEMLTEIAAHLDRHGITATVGLLPDSDTPAAILLAEAHRISADVIVAGG